MFRGSLRLVLERTGSGEGKRQDWIGGSAWPTVFTVPEPVGRAKGGFGLGTRTERNDRRCLIVANKHELR